MRTSASNSSVGILSTVAGAPPGYNELKEFLPTVKQREIALGVTGNTITSWDRNSASRIVKRHKETVNIVLDTLYKISTIVGAPERAGRIYTSPFPFTRDMIPAQLILAGGRAEADIFIKVVLKMQRIAEQTILQRISNDKELWKAVEASLSATSRAQGKGATTAVEKYEEITGGTAILD